MSRKLTLSWKIALTFFVVTAKSLARRQGRRPALRRSIQQSRGRSSRGLAGDGSARRQGLRLVRAACRRKGRHRDHRGRAGTWMALHLDFPRLHRRSLEMAAVVRDDQISVRARTAAPRTCRSLGSLVIASMSGSKPSIQTSGKCRRSSASRRALWRRKRLAAMPALRGTDRRDHRRLSIASLIGRYE
jgi:hypothetical protein